MFCVCKQKYDATKFYVGCDICSNWFHGSCVKITLSGHVAMKTEPSQPEEPAPQPVTPPKPAPAPQSLLSSPSKQQTSPAPASLPVSVIKQGHSVIKDGKKALALSAQAAPALSSQQSLLLQSLTSPPRQTATPALPAPTLGWLTTGGDGDDKSELTEDYIQQTIKDTLKGGNLTPKLQEKLMSQLDGSNMPESLAKNRTRNICRKAAGKGLGGGEVVDGERQAREFGNSRGDKGGKTRRRPRSELKKSDMEDELESEFYKFPPRKVIKKLRVGLLVDDKKKVTQSFSAKPGMFWHGCA